MTYRELLLSIFLLSLLLMSFPSLGDTNKSSITSINGIANYPNNYQGTPHREPGQDPYISPKNSALILIDYQPHILAGVRNIEHATLINNTKGLIKSAVAFNLPIIFSHVGVGLNGSKPFLDELLSLAPNAIIIDRTSVNAWEEKEFVDAVTALGRTKLIMAGLWTDVCLAYPAIEAVNSGYQVLVPEDAVGSFTPMSHNNGMRRMIQAGVIPITWNVVPAELQRDHARSPTVKATTRIFMEYLFKVNPNSEWK